MTTQELVERFMVALGQLEQHGDSEGIVALYSPDGVAGNVLDPGAPGSDAVRAFWERYRATFQTVSSRFEQVLAGAEGASLEWETTASGPNGDVVYRGVTVLGVDPATGSIRRSFAYYDSHGLGRQVVEAPGPSAEEAGDTITVGPAS